MSDEKLQEFMDDCVAMAEAMRCLRDKGAEGFDPDGVTLKAEVFDRCFPGTAWEAVLIDGEPIGLEVKRAEYRGFAFDAIREAEDGGPSRASAPTDTEEVRG
jgi:hypothetical protein